MEENAETRKVRPEHAVVQEVVGEFRRFRDIRLWTGEIRELCSHGLHLWVVAQQHSVCSNLTVDDSVVVQVLERGSDLCGDIGRYVGTYFF